MTNPAPAIAFDELMATLTDMAKIASDVQPERTAEFSDAVRHAFIFLSGGVDDDDEAEFIEGGPFPSEEPEFIEMTPADGASIRGEAAPVRYPDDNRRQMQEMLRQTVDAFRT